MAHGAQVVSDCLAHSRRILHGGRPGLKGSGMIRSRVDVSGCNPQPWRSARQRSVGQRHASRSASRGASAARLALAIAGTFCALASVAGAAWQASVISNGLWRDQLVRLGIWNGDEAQHGLITAPLVYGHRVPAVFLELLGNSWLIRLSVAADAFSLSLIRRCAFSLPAARPGMSTILGAGLQIRWSPPALCATLQ